MSKLEHSTEDFHFFKMGECDDEGLKKALSKVISAKHADMLDVNLKTIKLGAEL